MLQTRYYLSDPEDLKIVLDLTELTLDELEALVGRFAPHSHRAGKLRGMLVEDMLGNLEIRHHFRTNQVYWSNEVNT